MISRLSYPGQLLGYLKAAALYWTAISLFAGLSVITGWRHVEWHQSKQRIKQAQENDPGLIAKYTEYVGFSTTSGFSYPKIRVFHKPNPNEDKLGTSIPLLVFTHGLGGSASQFDPLLTSLINIATCVALDLPGCGLSESSPTDPAAYTTHALAGLVAAVARRYRDKNADQKIVLIGHSLGCSINALLASSTSPLAHELEGLVVGMIAICPSAKSLTPHETARLAMLAQMPSPIFDLIRLLDRRGGTTSRSVTRVLGTNADDATKRRQMTFNRQSESSVFLRMLKGTLGNTGMPGEEVWSGIRLPLFLVAGDSDIITPKDEVAKITAWLSKSPGNAEQFQSRTDSIAVPTTSGDTATAEPATASTTAQTQHPRTESGIVIQEDKVMSKHGATLKTTIFPAPASHGLLYTTSTIRMLAGMIENFLSHHVDRHLSTSWQLQHLATSGKWDVKNLAKWQAVDACSAPIGGIFRAMKTMREVDPEHSPKRFVEKYSSKVLPDGVAAVVDISHETPVYHYQGLVDAGVLYHKFPTVSKEKPRQEEVARFIELIDELRKDYLKQEQGRPRELRPTIGVHCHYGFNRTGFFIVSYLVEREGYTVGDALKEFEEKRPPGIRHSHFVNELFLRYEMKVERKRLLKK